MTTVEAAVATAFELPRPEDAVGAVRSIVIKEIERLDPEVEIQETEYFNHTIVPDLVLTWRQGRRNSSSRELFLRSSLRASTSLDNFAALGRTATSARLAPALLVLRSEDDPTVRGFASHEVASAPEVLLTDVAALDDFSPDGLSELPVRALIQRNLVRGGRGLIDNQVAGELTSQASPTEDGSVNLEAFSQTIRRSFVGDAATRIERAAQLISWAFEDDLGRLDDGRDETHGGRLSQSEIRLLLPYLLRTDGVTTDPRYWRHLGAMLTLADLEDMAPALLGLDLTPLVVPNLDVWTAARASVSLYLPEDEIDAEREALTLALDSLAQKPHSRRASQRVERAELAVARRAMSLDPRGRWTIHANMISAAIGDWRMHVGANGSRLKAGDGRAARLEALVDLLGRFRVAAIGIDGLERSLALTSSSATEDVRAFISTVEDDYYVRSLRIVGGDTEAEIEVGFADRLVTALPRASVRELCVAAVELLGHTRPPSPDEIDQVLPPN